ncbi:hypothetical protein AALP_AAs48252U000700 [Arabis alpina]|uniref:Uncharacterized protein n=1 Tax=Arabis alpina TaxID=50452 RepID=A0A087FWF6_ARAAL|nr:hypothetical protein AALP_AAs48252U000700 [Arabis alpina]
MEIESQKMRFIIFTYQWRQVCRRSSARSSVNPFGVAWIKTEGMLVVESSM